jgi:hypothetical protein
MPRVAWKNFTDGRALARGLGLKGKTGWREWSKSGQRPSGIPSNPSVTYRDDGWISWPDWLGSEGRVYPKWKSFTEARALVPGLGLKGWRGWFAWSKSENRPSDIPANPDRVYRDDGWISWNDWLGNGKERVAWKSFTEGRAFVRGLGLKSKSGWQEWKKNGQRPSDIPSAPDETYRNDGWVSWPDWLGSQRVAWRSFTEGRALVRGLGLKGERAWRAWSKSAQRPSDIPSLPSSVYRDDGWISWPDWLGNGNERVAWKSFTEARAAARGLELKGFRGWKEGSMSGQRPSDIPSHPDQAYRDDGWISWPDWLGFEGRAPRGSMLPFAVGRAYARKLKLRNIKEWKEWSKSGQRPSNIPSDPAKTYRADGWISMSDWLGYGKERVLAKDMLPFAVGQAYARKLELRSVKEWKEWSKSGQRPSDIPSDPPVAYRNDGWISYPDWLGYGSEGGVSAASSRSSSSSSSATTAPKKTKKKRKRRPTTSHPSDLPPPPPPSTSSSKPTVKAEPPSSKSSGGSSDRSTEPPLRKIKKEEDA